MLNFKAKRGNSSVSRTTAAKSVKATVDVVQYDVETNTISATIRKKTESVNNPLLAHLIKNH